MERLYILYQDKVDICKELASTVSYCITTNGCIYYEKSKTCEILAAFGPFTSKEHVYTSAKLLMKTIKTLAIF